MKQYPYPPSKSNPLIDLWIRIRLLMLPNNTDITTLRPLNLSSQQSQSLSNMHNLTNKPHLRIRGHRPQISNLKIATHTPERKLPLFRNPQQNSRRQHIYQSSSTAAMQVAHIVAHRRRDLKEK